MSKSLFFMTLVISMIFSLQALKVSNSHMFASSNHKMSHTGNLKNFSYAVIDANFTGASGTYFSDRLVSIQFKFVDQDSGSQKKSQMYGPQWGIPFDWNVPKDQSMDAVQFWKDDFLVNGMRFVTNKEQKSDLFGVSTGKYEIQNLDGRSIVGLQGVYCGGGIRVLQLILA